MTCSLRQNVKFQDGTNFNAQAVKWNFDRLYNMINQIPEQIPQASLWQLPDGTPIIKQTLVINELYI